jgi:RNA polymerase sigma factor (sigma-70 family)
VLRRRGHEFEDVLQTALLALAKIAPKFDPSRGFTFSTFATKCIWNRLAQFAQRGGRQVAAFGMPDEFDAADPHSTDAAEAFAEADGNEALRAQLDAALASLPEASEIAMRRRAEGETFMSIATDLGVCKQAVQQRVRAAQRQLSRTLADVA